MKKTFTIQAGQETRPWGWIYFGFHGGMLPRVLCSCSGVHLKRGLEPIPITRRPAVEVCDMCMNVGIHPVPFTELLNQLDAYAYLR